MTHKIKVQMFGNFRMDYNGAPFVAEKMHKESQFNRMMQALIHYSDCGIAKDKLEEIVIGERDIDAPHTALRVIVYKTKQKLAQLGLPGKNLIYLEGGIYYWTPDIEIEEDAAEFEKLYNEACALEKQMPQEPESAETVCDERIKEIEDNMLELYVRAHTADILTIHQMSWHGSRASTIICCMMIFQDKQINVAGHTVRCEQ